MSAISRPQMAAAVLVLAALALGGRWLATTRPPGATAPAAPARTTTSEVTVRAPSRTVTVHVAGAVRRPGVYRLREGDRVQDAVRRAGGVRRDGDPDAINLAALVADGAQVVVPARAPSSPGAAVAAGGAASPGPAAPISLGTATAEQLDTLDGVGPATAAKILAYRTEHGGFRSVDDLGQVSGIGPKKLEALRSQVRP